MKVTLKGESFTVSAKQEQAVVQDNQLEILEMPSMMEESKISVGVLKSKLDTAEEKLSYLEGQTERFSLEATQKDKQMGERY